jgi:hypothetical protein
MCHRRILSHAIIAQEQARVMRYARHCSCLIVRSGKTLNTCQAFHGRETAYVHYTLMYDKMPNRKKKPMYVWILGNPESSFCSSANAKILSISRSRQTRHMHTALYSKNRKKSLKTDIQKRSKGPEQTYSIPSNHGRKIQMPIDYAYWFFAGRLQLFISPRDSGKRKEKGSSLPVMRGRAS